MHLRTSDGRRRRAFRRTLPKITITDRSNALKKLLQLLGVVVVGVEVMIMTATPSFATPVRYSISDPKSDQTFYGSKPSPAQKKQDDIVRVTYGRDAGRVWVRVRM